MGALVLIWLARRPRSRLVAGDLLLIFFVWYGVTRFALEGFRVDNWTFFGIPTARIVTLGFILFGVLGLIWRHGPGRPAELAADLIPARAPEPTEDEQEDAFWADEPATAGQADVEADPGQEPDAGEAALDEDDVDDAGPDDLERPPRSPGRE